MDKTQILKTLESINYPNLDKNIVELKLIDALHVKANHLNIIIDTANEEAFLHIANKIQDVLKNHFKDIKVDKKPLQKSKSLNYGSSKNPNNRAPYAKKVIAISSGKGGVGKSTISANFAVGLAQKGYKVGLLDADVYGPNIPRLFGIEHEKLAWDEKNKIVPHENFGIKIMSVGFTTPKSDTPLVWRSSVAISALVQFLEDVAWGELDFLVIDMPPGTGDVQLSMAEELPLFGALIVTTPQTLSIDDVSRAIMMFKEVNVPILGLVENMSYFQAPDTKTRYEIFGKSKAHELCKRYNIKLLGQIPLDIVVRELSDVGKLPIAFGDDKIKKIYKNLCKEF
jgi:ATP-binding protein involved in chromosome partitioning